MNHVEQDGAALEQKLSDTVTMTKFSVGPTDNDIYLLSDSKGTLMIDAANRPDRIDDVLAGREVAAIVTTHRHPDHIQALAAMARRTNARLICGEPDQQAIAKATGVVNETVWTGDVVRLPAGEELAVIGLVGHTPGAIALAYAAEGSPAHLFTGDSLFPGGVGKTNSPEDFSSLITHVESQLFDAYADDTVFHPGHGDCSTLGAERPNLAEWRARGW